MADFLASIWANLTGHGKDGEEVLGTGRLVDAVPDTALDEVIELRFDDAVSLDGFRAAEEAEEAGGASRMESGTVVGPDGSLNASSGSMIIASSLSGPSAPLGSESRKGKKIMIPVDESVGCYAAFVAAIGLIDPSRDSLYVVAVVPNELSRGGQDPVVYTRAKRLVAYYLQAARSAHLEIVIGMVGRSFHLGEFVCLAAEGHGIDLIVLARTPKSRQGFRTKPLGSTAKHIVVHASADVLVVKGEIVHPPKPQDPDHPDPNHQDPNHQDPNHQDPNQGQDQL